MVSVVTVTHAAVEEKRATSGLRLSCTLPTFSTPDLSSLLNPRGSHLEVGRSVNLFLPVGTPGRGRRGGAEVAVREIVMGNCLAAPENGDATLCLGLNYSKNNRDVKKLSGSSSKVSAASGPLTPRCEGEILLSANVKSFTFNELRTATRNFKLDNVVGEGGFGSVFKGWIDEQTLTPSRPSSGVVIAVKKLNQESFQGHREWLAEVNFLGQLSHPHLVKLIGYCLEDEQRLLVYEFMPRGSLENHLFRSKSLCNGGIFFSSSPIDAGGSCVPPISWKLRMKIALGAAKGLAFLHSDMAKVIYRDFKASNVLLDSNYNAKLSDFGLAKDGPTGDKSHVSTRIMGTYGYAAPEYLATGHLTSKSDVYSFGVVLLELLSGRRAVDRNRPTGEHNLVEWARPYLTSKRRIFRVLDTRLGGQYSLAGAQNAATLAIQCLSMDARRRPTMDQVVTALECLQDPKDIPRNPQAGHNSTPKFIYNDSHKSPRRRSDEIAHGKVARPMVAASPHYTK
ncbi:hypothetical protein ZIOFF_033116 [Zingiber officinale]|uniref:non-specific serine/threonine protein kinase n=1 Tax=Zingiber officinale TaxID=94328 RepID=A0A8J5GHE9_ZINOF|nr:hypothetical protein ZIOFF_033116 [Zingiber officinale]